MAAMRRYHYIDIFAGCGGLSLGLYNSGWEGLFAIEKNPYAFATLKHNLIDQKKHFEWVDWLELEEHDINDVINSKETEIEKLADKVQLVVGAPPCQGFSMAGQRDRNDARNKMVYSYIRFVELVKPELVFFENVRGITIGFRDNDDKVEKPASSSIVEKLRGLGYCIESEIIDMYDYGVPQRRRRFILVGSLHKDPKLFFKHLNDNRNPFLRGKNLPEYSTVSQAIGDLVLQEDIDCPDSRGFKSGKYGRATSDYQKVMRLGIDEDDVPNSHRFAKHKKGTVELFERMLEECDRNKRLSPGKAKIEGLKKRGLTILDENHPCNTITSHPDDYLHYMQPRIMTVRECARIQSFPDWYEFKGKYTTGGKLRKNEVPRYTQVGNAIPPLFAEQVGYALKVMVRGNV